MADDQLSVDLHSDRRHGSVSGASVTSGTSATSGGSGSSSPSKIKKYACDFANCTKSYAKPSLLEQHKRSHTGERPFVCDHPGCDKSFLRKAHLTAHVISHSTAKPFQCKVCGKGVNSIQHLKRHEITHTKSFACDHPGCTESFYKHQSLRHHILSVHDKTLQCKICNKVFKRPYRLSQHNLKYHGESPAYQCDNTGCFSNFKTWSALQLHIKTEHPKLRCPVCKKKCIGKNGLRSHMLVHTDETPQSTWKCNYCNLGRFSKKLDLVKHYQKFHDNNIPPELFNKNEQGDYILDDSCTISLNSSNLKTYEALSSDSESEEEQEAQAVPSSAKSISSLNSTLHSQSIINLISGNFSTRKIPCTKKNCDRMFTREYDLKRHLKWHEEHLRKIELFLEGISKDECEEGKTDNSFGPSIKRRKIADIGGSTEAPDYGESENEANQGSASVNFESRAEVTYADFSSDSSEEDLDDLIDEELLRLKAGESIA